MASERLHRLALLAIVAAPALLGASSPQGASLHLSIEGLRNAKGSVLLCLTQREAFLKCADDPRRLSRSVNAEESGTVDFDDVPTGDWTLLVVHDENRNGKLDTMMGLPREGFGFSRNPVIRFGPPAYRQVRFPVLGGQARQSVRVRYLL